MGTQEINSSFSLFSPSHFLSLLLLLAFEQRSPLQATGEPGTSCRGLTGPGQVEDGSRGAGGKSAVRMCHFSARLVELVAVA